MTTAAVAVHFFAHAAHGVVHELIPVRIAPWQTGFVVVAMFALPIVGVVLFVRDRPGGGAWLLLGAGLASLGFETAFHFVLENPDYVGSVEAGVAVFAGTAVLAAASDLLLIAVGARWLLVHRHGGSTRSAIESRT